MSKSIVNKRRRGLLSRFVRANVRILALAMIVIVGAAGATILFANREQVSAATIYLDTGPIFSGSNVGSCDWTPDNVPGWGAMGHSCWHTTGIYNGQTVDVICRCADPGDNYPPPQDNGDGSLCLADSSARQREPSPLS